MKPEPPGTDSPRAGPGEASPVEPPPADLPEDHVPETGAAEETGAGGKTEAPKTMPVEGDASVLEKHDSVHTKRYVSQEGCPVQAPFGGSDLTLADPETDHAMDVDSSEKKDGSGSLPQTTAEQAMEVAHQDPYVQPPVGAVHVVESEGNANQPEPQVEPPEVQRQDANLTHVVEPVQTTEPKVPVPAQVVQTSPGPLPEAPPLKSETPGPVESENMSMPPPNHVLEKKRGRDANEYFQTLSVPPPRLSDSAIYSRLNRVFKPKMNGSYQLDERWMNAWKDIKGGRDELYSMFEKVGYSVDKGLAKKNAYHFFKFEGMFHHIFCFRGPIAKLPCQFPAPARRNSLSGARQSRSTSPRSPPRLRGSGSLWLTWKAISFQSPFDVYQWAMPVFKSKL